MFETVTRSFQSVLDQMITSLPTLGYALLILLVGWFVAKIAGGIVTRRLHRTDLDNRLVQSLGMGWLLVDRTGKQRSAESVMGRFIYYFILLFVIVAFFNVLNIPVITDPINQMLSKVTGAVPNILEALIILLIAWGIATLARAGVTRLFRTTGFEEKIARWGIREEREREGVSPLTDSMGNLVFYLILLFAIPPFMDALGQSAVVAPLREMFTKAIGFLPNLFAALVILLIGWIAAKVVKDIVSNLLISAGVDAGAERLGLGRILAGTRVSQILGYLVYFFILIPAVVAALDTLQLRALSEPITIQLTRILNAVPSLIYAAILIVAGYVIAQLVRGLLVTFLTNLGFNTFPSKIGLAALTPGEGRRTLSEIAGSIFVVVVMLFVAMEAFEAIGLARLSELTQAFILFLPPVFFALVLIAAGLALGNYVEGLVRGMVEGKGGMAVLIPLAAKVTIIVFAGAMALQQLGIGDEIVTVAFAILLGAVSLAMALAFGLGSKDLVSKYLNQKFSNEAEKRSGR